jgi:hypothetical protein
LVVTSLHDPTADVVISELHDRGVPVVRLDSGDFPASLSVEAEITEHGLRGRLDTPSRTADLANVRALYYRRPTGFAFPHLDEQDARFAITQARYGLGGVLASLPGCLYVNHPHRLGDAEFKPAGLAAAAGAGFLVPPTLITSSPDAARNFIKRHGSVIYKPLSNPVYRVDGVSAVVKVAEVSATDIDDTVAALRICSSSASARSPTSGSPSSAETCSASVSTPTSSTGAPTTASSPTPPSRRRPASGRRSTAT